MLSHPKEKFFSEFGLNWLYRMSHNFVVRLTSFQRKWRHWKKCPTLSLYVVMNATFKVKHSKLKGMQEKEPNVCSVRIENSILCDHCFASLGKALWCQTVTLVMELSVRTSYPCKILTLHVRFLYYIHWTKETWNWVISNIKLKIKQKNITLWWYSQLSFLNFCNVPKYWDKHVRANIVVPGQTAPEVAAWSGSTVILSTPFGHIN